MQVVRMSRARRLNGGAGYSHSLVMKVLAGERHNRAVVALHDEVVALRTPSAKPTGRKAAKP